MKAAQHMGTFSLSIAEGQSVACLDDIQVCIYEGVS